MDDDGFNQDCERILLEQEMGSVCDFLCGPLFLPPMPPVAPPPAVTVGTELAVCQTVEG